MNVRVGVVENLTGPNERKQNGTLQILDEELISGNNLLVLRPARLGMLCELEELPWPCTADVIMNLTRLVRSTGICFLREFDVT